MLSSLRHHLIVPIQTAAQAAAAAAAARVKTSDRNQSKVRSDFLAEVDMKVERVS